MAQFDYKRASLSTSVDMYKIGKSYFCYLHYCGTNASKLTMSELVVSTSVKEYCLGVGFCYPVVPSSMSQNLPPAFVVHQVPINSTLCFNPLTFLLLRTFLQCQVVTGMEAEQIIESLTNYT